jgi:hypothetical protein
MRNQIEGKFGQGKNAYDLNRVRTRTARTGESWVACIMFVMNLIKFSQVFLSFFKKWFKKLFPNLFAPNLDQLACIFQYGSGRLIHQTLFKSEK